MRFLLNGIAALQGWLCRYLARGVDVDTQTDDLPGRGPYEIEFRWKEEVIYWEGDRGFMFPGGWGVTPVVTYVPAEEDWDRVMPDWLVGRMPVVMERLRAEPHHRVETDTYPSHPMQHCTMTR